MKAVLQADIKNDLRKSHFHFGSEGPQYATSAKQSLIKHEICND